jgi:hypothetical protein
MIRKFYLYCLCLLKPGYSSIFGGAGFLWAPEDSLSRIGGFVLGHRPETVILGPVLYCRVIKTGVLQETGFIIPVRCKLSREDMPK